MTENGLRKCNFCDKVGKKTVDIMSDDCVKFDGKYAHINCYKNHLVTRKKCKLTENEAISEISRLVELNKSHIEDIYYRNALMDIIFKKYEITAVSTFFYKKLDDINNGDYKGILKNGISNFELYEMYSNEKLLRKLDNIAFKNNVRQDERPNYDLAVVINEYPNYVKFKQRSMDSREEVNESVKDMKRYKTKMVRKPIEQDNDIDIVSLVEWLDGGIDESGDNT